MLGEPRVKAWAVKVTAITMRKDAIYHAMLTGMPQTEDQALARWALAANAYRAASQVADIKAVNVTAAGGGYHHFIVSIKKHGDMDARSVIYAINGSRNFSRLIIVVDDDIDVFNPADVEYAMGTRMLPDKDIVITPPVSRGLGESSAFERISARWSIDATMPLKDKEWYQKIRVPGVENVDYV
jgi:2,5-furandicarboxylate decarboxylase 1